MQAQAKPTEKKDHRIEYILLAGCALLPALFLTV